ncbi:MAG: hypothetical protein H0U74_19290 [Bradymonadaceae bacterium]|nr:hypothetical protein [Lujinxingiaceae bacterium]
MNFTIDTGSYATSVRRFCSVLVLFCLLAACGDDQTPTTVIPIDRSDVSDVGIELDVFVVDDVHYADEVSFDVADTPDVAVIEDTPIVIDAGEPNACGGFDALLFEGELGAPGSACGACDDGVLVCDGADALRCLGAGALNACGGCIRLEAAIDDACGRCGDGTYQCTDEGTLECEDAGALNACGGCAELAGAPGHGCTTSSETAGTYACTGAETLRCAAPGENACGGPGALSAKPGSPCGTCNLGVVACDGLNTTLCEDAERGSNACGGCMALAGAPESSCGVCEGRWTCAGEDDVLCDDAARNLCGGCELLGAGEPGEVCSASGVFVCANAESLVCPAQASNACGGQSELSATPGDACGPCGDGHIVCASLESTACIGARAENVCGGCALLPAAPGEACGADAIWNCTDDARLACQSDTTKNACGGTDVLDDQPGSPCGPCGFDTIQCTSAQTVSCSAQTPCPELTLATEAASTIGASWATFHAVASVLPQALVTDHGFCFKRPGQAEICRTLGALPQPRAFSHVESALLPGRTYVVRAYARSGQNTTYANEVNFTTLAPPVQAFTASKGSFVEHVALGWQPIVGASEYIVYRDDVEFTRVASAGHLDTGATAGSVPSVASLSATAGTHTDFVRVSWPAATATLGAMHTYRVVAVYPDAQSTSSAGVVGYRDAFALGRYELSIEGGTFFDVGAALVYDHTSAPLGTIVPSVATAGQGQNAAHVALALSGPATVETRSQRYVLRAVNAAGTGATSPQATGYRGVTGVTYQWQRSAADSNADFTDLVGAQATTFNDTTAPADASARYYRARINAQGAPTQHSNAVVGFRALQAQVTTIDLLTRDTETITTSSATLYGALTTLGAPAPASMGFCYHHTLTTPTHADIDLDNDGALCTTVAPLAATGEFSAGIADLEAGTTYYVRAFVQTIATGTGYHYGAAVSFDTRTAAPQNVTTESAVGHVLVSFDEVTGAASYRVIRDIGSPNEAIVDAELIDLGQGRVGVEDEGASAGGLPAAPSLSVTGGADALTEAIKLSWSMPGVPAGDEHTYTVIALGQDDLESAASAPPEPGRRIGAPVTGYEIKVGAADFAPITHTTENGSLVWLDTSASGQGELSIDSILASQGAYPDRIELEAVGADKQDGPNVSYQVRAINSQDAAGSASSAQTGNRGVGTILYQWFYSDSGAAGPFVALASPPSATADSATDTAPVPGADRHYYIELSAAGAATASSAVHSGYRARAASVTTGTIDQITTSSVRIAGLITDLGRPTVSEHGFCYALASASCTAASATCTTLGASTSLETYTETLTLAAGQSYKLCAYVTNNAATSYGAERIVSMLPGAPTNVSATQGTIEAHVLVGLNAVAGATSYEIYREDSLGTKVLVETITVTDAATPSYSFEDDAATLAAPAPLAPALELVTNMIDRVRIAWLAAVTPAGAAHIYTVVALNSAGSSASSAGAEGWRAPKSVTGYEVRAALGEAAFGAWSDASNPANLYHEDMLAPAGSIQIVPDSASASDGTHTAHVVLTTGEATGAAGTTVRYEVRATTAAEPGAALSTSGNRSVGAIGYQWERSENGSDWAILAGASARAFNDTSAELADGVARHYRVVLSAAGATNVTQSAGTGFRAVQATVETLDPLVRDPDNITTTSARLYANLTTLGAPAPAAMGFCYSATIAAPSIDDAGQGAVCLSVAQLTEPGEYWAVAMSLTPGTTYNVRAFVRTSAVGAGYAYGDVVTFDTRTSAPQNVSTENAVAHVAVSWDSVSGAASYKVVRNAGTASEAIVGATVVDLGEGRFGLEDTGAAPGGPPLTPALSATGAASARTDGIALSWSAVGLVDGAVQSYTVIAVGQDALESAPSASASGRRLGAPVAGYQVKVGAAAFATVTATELDGALSWLDSSATTLGSLSLTAIAASKGTHSDRVALDAQGAASQDGASHSYQVRAFNTLNSFGDASIVRTGNRSAGTIGYQWYYSADGAPGSFVALAGAQAASSNDTDASLPAGVDRHYYIELSAPGAASLNSSTDTGYKALAATVTTSAPD